MINPRRISSTLLHSPSKGHTHEHIMTRTTHSCLHLQSLKLNIFLSNNQTITTTSKYHHQCLQGYLHLQENTLYPSIKSRSPSRMPTQEAPARFKFRWHVARALLTVIVFVLGVSGAIGGSRLADNSNQNEMKHTWGLLCLYLGLFSILLGIGLFMLTIFCWTGKRQKFKNMPRSTELENVSV